VEQQIDRRLETGHAQLSPGDAAAEAGIKTLFARVDRLKQFLTDYPAFNLPELQLLNEDSWITAAAGHDLDSEERIRRALASLRTQASDNLDSGIQQALTAYLKAHDDILPESPIALAPYLNAKFDPAWLERYEMLEKGKAGALSFENQFNVMLVKSPADVEYDDICGVGVRSTFSTSALRYDVNSAQEAYSHDHGGQKTSDARQLSPYLRWPVEPAALQKFLDPTATAKRP
jgi:hypothetical protein